MVSVLGGTGLLGQRASAELVARGHDVFSVSRNPIPPGRRRLVEVEQRCADIVAADTATLRKVLSGADALVYALGPDDRCQVRGDPAAFFQACLVETTERVIRVAGATGVERIVLLGSYFTTWERMHPDSGFASRHPYVQARVDQLAAAVAAAGEAGVRLCVLEIPYVFGLIDGEGQRWRELLFDRTSKPVVLFPTGGTSVITSIQVGEAVAGALQRGEHGACYPLSDIDLTWREILSHVLQARGKTRTPIFGAPAWLTQLGVRSMARSLEARGLRSGLDPRYVVRDVLTQHMYVDATESRDVLRYTPGGVPQAIRALVRDAYGLPGQDPPVSDRIGRSARR